MTTSTKNKEAIVIFRGSKKSLGLDEGETSQMNFDFNDMVNMFRMHNPCETPTLEGHFELLQRATLISGDFIESYIFNGIDYVKEIISDLAMVHSCEMIVYERACIELPSFNNLDPSDAISFIQMVKHFEEIA